MAYPSSTRLNQIVLTLTGVAQQLGASDSLTEIGIREIVLQPRETNTNPIYVGVSNSVSSTVYSVRLPAPSGGIPPAPFILGEFEDGTVKLGDLWVIGTNTEILHILAVRVVHA